MSQFALPDDLLLQGRKVRLIPLTQSSLNSLFEAAQDPAIWELTSVNYSRPEIFHPHFDATFASKAKGEVFPFLILDAVGHKVVGTTRYLELAPADRRLEIGVTWIRSEYFGTGTNDECKLLLLQHCFDVLGTNRVQFRAKSTNARSRRALEKIGATFEGVMRKDKIEPSGVARDTAYYSVIDSDWPTVKQVLAKRLSLLSAP